MWYLKVSKNLAKYAFIFIITIHKIFPILFLRKVLLYLRNVSIIVIFIFLSRKLVIENRLLFLTILYSSLINSLWITIRGALRYNFIIVYWIVYCLITIFIIISLWRKIILFRAFSQVSLTRFLWLVLVGMPPFVIFWAKAQLFIFLIKFLGTLVSLLTIIVSVFLLRAYYRTWFISLFLVRHEIRSLFLVMILFFIFFTLFS